MRLETVTSSGRGAHLASAGQDQALCMRPMLARTGREGSAKTPLLCQTCARTLAHLAQAGRPR